MGGNKIEKYNSSTRLRSGLIFAIILALVVAFASQFLNIYKNIASAAICNEGGTTWSNQSGWSQTRGKCIGYKTDFQAFQGSPDSQRYIINVHTKNGKWPTDGAYPVLYTSYNDQTNTDKMNKSSIGFSKTGTEGVYTSSAYVSTIYMQTSDNSCQSTMQKNKSPYNFKIVFGDQESDAFDICKNGSKAQDGNLDFTLDHTGTGTGSDTSVGGITGVFGIIDGSGKTHMIEQNGITKFSLKSKTTGKEVATYDTVNKNWTVNSGTLTIKDIPPGKYTLAFTYNDGMVVASKSEAREALPTVEFKVDNIVVNGGAITKLDTMYLDKDGKAYTQKDADDKGNETEATENASNCNLGALGWIICPVLGMLEGVITWAMDFIGGQLNYGVLADGGSSGDSIKQAWGTMLTIANVAFAIAFIILIYSTATSTGLTNYSIKKMLPRLIIGAILVNLSFYICAALADLSNIIGANISELLANAGKSIDGGYQEGWAGTLGKSVGAITIGIPITVIAAGLLLLMFWSTAVIGIVIVLVALTFRTVAITALIIISPIACVAWLLPNTDKWFKKWLQFFVQMLIAYPLVMLVWGVAQFMISVLSKSSQDPLSALLSPIILLIPVGALIPIFKMSGGAMAKLTGAVQGGVNKAGGDQLRKFNQDQNKLTRAGISQRAKTASTKYPNSKAARLVSSNAQRAEMRRVRLRSINQAEERSSAEYLGGLMEASDQGNESATKKLKSLGGGDAERGRRIASANIAKIRKEDREAAAESLTRSAGYDDFDTMIAQANTGTDMEHRTAALERASTLATPEQVSQLLQTASGMGSQQYKNIASDIVAQSSAFKAHPELGGGTRGGMTGSKFSSNADVMAHQMSRSADALSAQGLPGLDTRSLKNLGEVLSTKNKDAVVAARAKQFSTEKVAEKLRAHPGMDEATVRAQMANDEFSKAVTALESSIHGAASDERISHGISQEKREASDEVLAAIGRSPGSPIAWK